MTLSAADRDHVADLVALAVPQAATAAARATHGEQFMVCRAYFDDIQRQLGELVTLSREQGQALARHEGKHDAAGAAGAGGKRTRLESVRAWVSAIRPVAPWAALVMVAALFSPHLPAIIASFRAASRGAP